MGEVIIAGRAFSIDAPVRNWFETGWNAAAEHAIPLAGRPKHPHDRVATPSQPRRGPRRFSARPMLRSFGNTPPLEAVKSTIRQFILHHDGCASAEMCFDVLHNERGLSCHFLIDNDGTIYQTLDLGLMAWHAAFYNASSIGVEISSRGDAKKSPGFYKDGHGPRRVTKACNINGHTYLAYDFTQSQYQAFAALAKALTKLLPNLPVEYPQKQAGQQAWETMPYGSGYAGYLGHYHCTTAKWDPGPFDLKAFCSQLRGAFCFPLWLGDRSVDAKESPTIPNRADELKARTMEFYRANEQRADAGYFPLAPWGESRLWHGGIHLRGTLGQPIFAPFPGRLVAARFGRGGAIGSNNFLLLRHDLALGPRTLRFYSLYMHVALPTGEETPAWLVKQKPGVVLHLDEPVLAGALIGRMGLAGPDDLSAPQIHWEIFSSTPQLADLPGSPWEVIDGTAGGRTCFVEEINDTLRDTDGDRKLSRAEVIQAWTDGAAETLRRLVTFHVSEWAPLPSWAESLRQLPEFSDLANDELRELVDQQITPGLWWTADVARHAGLPLDGVVYHYHPATFVRFVNEKLLEAKAAPPPDAASAQIAPVGVTDDFGDVAGEHAVAEAETDEGHCDKQLGLEQLVLGFDAPECK